jgi:hypothetical protein
LVGIYLVLSVRVAAAQEPVAANTTAGIAVPAYVAAYNVHDSDGVVRLLHPDFVWLSLMGDSIAVEARGVPAIRALLVD